MHAFIPYSAGYALAVPVTSCARYAPDRSPSCEGYAPSSAGYAQHCSAGFLILRLKTAYNKYVHL
jgi:hypothetical protein